MSLVNSYHQNSIYQFRGRPCLTTHAFVFTIPHSGFLIWSVFIIYETIMQQIHSTTLWSLTFGNDIEFWNEKIKCINSSKINHRPDIISWRFTRLSNLNSSPWSITSAIHAPTIACTAHRIRNMKVTSLIAWRHF